MEIIIFIIKTFIISLIYRVGVLISDISSGVLLYGIFLSALDSALWQSNSIDLSMNQIQNLNYIGENKFVKCIEIRALLNQP